MGWTAIAGMALVSLMPTSTSFASGANPAPTAVSLTLAAVRSISPGDPSQENRVWATVVPAGSLIGTGGTLPGGGGVQGTRSPDGLRFVALRVKLGRRPPEVVLTNSATVPDLLIALGVRVRELDRVKPGPDSPIVDGGLVRVIRIRQVTETLTEDKAFPTTIQYSSELADGQVDILRPGVPGRAIRTYQITYRNGREIERIMLTEQVLVAPVPQIEERGTLASKHGTQTGQASWYDCPNDGMFAAHLSLPFGTVVTVTDVDNDKTVTVIIDDRGPYGVAGRVIDLCSAAFAALAPLGQGVADVSITW